MNRRLVIAGCLVGGLVLFFALYPSLKSFFITHYYSCTTAANKALCYTSVIDATLQSQGLVAAFNFVAVAYDTDRDFAAFCHSNTHQLGEAAYKQFHETGQVELSTKASYCGYGFYHGFLEELLVESRDLNDARTFCTYVGTQVPNPIGYAEGACYHGIGHGVTDGYDPTLWGDAKKIAAPGLALCSKVATTTEWYYRCASGVFNSVAILHRDPKYKLALTDDPYSLCRTPQYTEETRGACYSQMDTLVAFVSHEFGEAVGYAMEVDVQYREAAVLNVASISVQRLRKLSSEVLPREAVEVCGVLPTKERVACVRGLVDGLIEHGSPQDQYKDAITLCSSPVGLLVEPCYERLVQNLSRSGSREEVEGVCGRIPESYYKKCMARPVFTH